MPLKDQDITDKTDLAFVLRDLKTGKEKKIYLRGRIEGFEGSYSITNYVYPKFLRILAINEGIRDKIQKLKNFFDKYCNAEFI